MRAPSIFRQAGLGLLVLAGAVAQAQNMKPGLWEFTNKIQSGNGEIEKAMAQMQQQLASMPPAQRKQMEDAMAKQGVTMGANGTTVKACMTKEMTERNDMMGPQGDCKTTTVSRQGNTLKTAYTCTQPKMSGEGEVTFASPESFSSKAVMNTVTQGKPETTRMDGTGKWLSAECGAIKPFALPPQPAKK